MNLNQWNAVKAINGTPPLPTVNVFDMAVSRQSKTLLYGYDTEHHTWHVYMMGGAIHLLVTTGTIYEGDQIVGAREILRHEANVSWEVASLIPNKRLYPHFCDFEFVWVLLNKRVDLPFTTYDEDTLARRPGPFHGYIVP